jgi:hypothetical protein
VQWRSWSGQTVPWLIRPVNQITTTGNWNFIQEDFRRSVPDRDFGRSLGHGRRKGLHAKARAEKSIC